MRLENYQTFAEIYDVKELGDMRPDSDTRLHIATVQGMVKRLLYPGENEQPVNRKVLTENFNKTVCTTLAEHIDPSLPGKTLIFCVTDLHADMVVRLLKAAFDELYGSVHDDAVMKITGKADKPLQLIRRFKNEQLPKIVVTVDLLTTGIDVPPITNIVFLRRVKSRILFEQMLGRPQRSSSSRDAADHGEPTMDRAAAKVAGSDRQAVGTGGHR